MPVNADSPSLPAVDELANLPRAQLQALYRKLLKVDPPVRTSREFLSRNIAWALQVMDRGQNPLVLRKRLLNAAIRAAAGRSNALYKPGTRLIREWRGQVHEVTILEKGYLWNGRPFRSLSRIAEAITGTRRSGPRFFGLVTGPSDPDGTA